MPVQSLKDAYVEELRDLWSANDQMQRLMPSFAEKTSDAKLKQMFEKSVSGIGQHTETLRSLVEKQGGSVGAEHCKGMEGIVAEAQKHALGSGVSGPLGDVLLVAQYQRMSHYGLAGFGSAAAYAKALGLSDDAAKLKQIVSDIYQADEYTSKLAEQAEQAAAK